MIHNILAKIMRWPRGRQNVGFVLGALVSLVITVLLLLPGTRRWHEPGPRILGHAVLACAECHRLGQGTLRQRVQARVAQIVSATPRPTRTIGYTPVGNSDCLACHAMRQDAHAVYRFLEPRFAAARATLAPQLCVSCHREHSGARVTAGATACGACHDGMALKHDRVDVAHATLAAQHRWDTCLGCHDYHGNHTYLTPTQIHASVDRTTLTQYLRDGASPYGATSTHAKTTREEPDHEI